ncbi:hypothetical protein LCGC14_2016880, partial [marine sediment metagenome]
KDMVEDSLKARSALVPEASINIHSDVSDTWKSRIVRDIEQKVDVSTLSSEQERYYNMLAKAQSEKRKMLLEMGVNQRGAIIYNLPPDDPAHFKNFAEVTKAREQNEIKERNPEENKLGYHGHHLERRFILGIADSFAKLSDIKYKGKVKLPSERETGMWLDDAILMRLGEIFSAIGGGYYGFYSTYFTEKWIQKTEFKSDMINKLENFLAFVKGLTSTTRRKGLEAIKYYRTEMGYHTRSNNVNDLEWDFVRALQTAFSNELGKYVGVSELSTILKGWDGYFRRILHSTERNNIGTRTLNEITQKIKEPIAYKFYKETYRISLSDENIDIIENAVKTYSQLRLSGKLYKYNVPENAPNKEDIEIIEALRIAYSKHPVYNPSGAEITSSKLYTILKRNLFKVYNNEHHFTGRSVDYLLTHINDDLLYLYAPQEYELISSRLKTYDAHKHYTVGFGDNFQIDFGNIDLNNKLYSNQFISHLTRADLLDGHLPVDIIKYRKNHPKFWDRVSNFAYQITGVDSQVKSDFVKSLLSTNFASKDNGKIAFLKSNRQLFPTPIKQLVSLAQKSSYPQGLKSPVSGTPTHEAVLNNIMLYSKYAIASELPVWFKSGQNLLTGHIDLVLQIGDALYVVDYKPLDTPFLTSRISDNFINIVPQLATYGMIVKRSLNIKKVYCIAFNSEGAWVFEPEGILNKISDFMRQQNIADKILWDPYF